MNLRNLEYLVQEAFIGIWRNGIMAVASISTVALSMAILGAFLLMVVGSHRFIESRLVEFRVKVFMSTEASQADSERARRSIAHLPLTRRVEVLSREKEWRDFKKGTNLEFDVGGVVGNPLPYTLEVESRDAHKTDQLADQIRRIAGVHKVENAQRDYGHVKAMADLVRVLGAAAAAILCLTTIFIISNAIRLTLYARRHEIQIMQLVGATNWFIRVPLIIEGIVLGAVGAAVAVGLISGGSEYIAGLVRQEFPPMLGRLSSGVAWGGFLISLVTGGAVIGALGSLVSIRRFLKT